MQSLSSQPYKGSRDFYPADFNRRQWIYETCARVLRGFGYQEYDGPLLESFDLYAAKSGQELVDQQLYSFLDRGERKVAIRPEMTPTLARMVAAKLEEIPKPVRWFRFPNVWRYERPQKGRLREHWQLNVDVLGGDATWAETEILEIAGSLFKSFGAQKYVRFRINHRALMDAFYTQQLSLSSEIIPALSRILDGREKMSSEVFIQNLEKIQLTAAQIDKVQSFISSDLSQATKLCPCPAAEHLNVLFERLSKTSTPDVYHFDPSIVRGLDYYTGVVFEAFDVSPENNRALFGGGRYDNLMGLFHKNKSLSGVGLGMGDVVLSDFLDLHKLWPDLNQKNQIFISCLDDQLYNDVSKLAVSLRDSDLSVMTSLGSGSFKNQLKQADRLGVRWIILWGENEKKSNQVLVKELSTGNQDAVDIDQLLQWFKSRCN